MAFRPTATTASRLRIMQGQLDGRGLREVDDRAGDIVEVVREDVQRDMGHNLGDFRVSAACLPHGRHVGIVDHSPLFHHGPGKPKHPVGLGVGRRSAPAVEDILFGQPDGLANGRVRRHTVIAVILFAHVQGQLLPHPWPQNAMALSAPLKPR